MSLTCTECRCEGNELARGWVAFLGEDADGLEPTGVYPFCTECAAAEFGYRGERADEHDV